jgi:hypothetical protein
LTVIKPPQAPPKEGMFGYKNYRKPPQAPPKEGMFGYKNYRKPPQAPPKEGMFGYMICLLFIHCSYSFIIYLNTPPFGRAWVGFFILLSI